MHRKLKFSCKTAEIWYFRKKLQKLIELGSLSVASLRKDSQIQTSFSLLPVLNFKSFRTRIWPASRLPWPQLGPTSVCFWIVWTVFGLSGQFLISPDSFWIVRTVSRLSGHFLDCPDSFWIDRTVSRLSRYFLDCPDSFWIVRIVYWLSGQFLDCPDSFWIVRIVFGLSG